MKARETFQTVFADRKNNEGVLLQSGLATQWASTAETRLFDTVASFVLAEMAEECRSSEQMIGANAAIEKLKRFSTPKKEIVAPGTLPAKPLTSYA